MVIHRLLIVPDNHSNLRSRLFPNQIVPVAVEAAPMYVLSKSKGRRFIE